jgi:hypothetical protein
MKEKEVRNVSETFRNVVVTGFLRDSVYTGILACKLRDWLFCYKRPLSFQAGFVRPKKRVKNIIKIGTVLDRYFKQNVFPQPETNPHLQPHTIVTKSAFA